VAREAAAVVVEHAVPALRVAVRAELRVAAGVVVEAVHPALLVTHDQLRGVRRGAGLGAAAPAVAVLTAVVSDAQPALGHTLFGAEDPPGAFRQRVAHVDAALELAHRELIRVLAVILEATRRSAETRHVGEQRLAGVADDRVLLDALRPGRRLRVGARGERDDGGDGSADHLEA